jgi:hypothetical protein
MSLTTIRRSEWGAKPPRGYTTITPSNLFGVVVHWFGNPRAAGSHTLCAAQLRAVQATHMANVAEGYNDIAYNIAVCNHGTAYELRGFNVRAGANGTTYANTNYGAVVVMIGEGDTPTAAALETLTNVIHEYRRRGASTQVRPHGDFTGSACPGPDLRAWIAEKKYERKMTAKRRAILRAWILDRHAAGWPWKRIKATANWREYRRGGGQ